MAKAYWIAEYTAIHDPDKHAEYARIGGAAIAAGGGRFLARGGEATGLESADPLRVVVIEFPSHQAALDTYRSEDYQRALAVVDGAVERSVRIVTGVD